jgi:two-component system, LytTR family, response regulator
MKTLLIDDESSARSRLRRLLEEYKDIEIVDEAKDGLEAVTLIEKQKPELLFLDIEMPGLNGFEVLRSINTPAMPLTIFVTGYDQYALEAFRANALAYVLKPVDPEQLAKAIERARQISHSANGAARTQQAVTDKVIRAATTNFHQVVGRKGDRLVLMKPEQVLWFQVENGIVRATTQQGTFWVNFTLTELEAGFAPDVFFRARREVLVNLTAIRELRPYFKSGFVLVMNDAAGTEIVVSERQVPAFRTRVPGL